MEPTENKAKNKNTGRKSKYKPAIADYICEIVSSSNKSLSTICKDDKVNISLSTAFKWLNEQKEFSDKYARAKELQADFLAEEIIEIADDTSRDIDLVYLGDGVTSERENHEFISRSRVRIDARKWVASKLKPKKYGDKLDLGVVITDERERILSLFPTDEEFNNQTQNQ